MAKFTLNLETDDNDEFARLMQNLTMPTGIIIAGAPGQKFEVGLLNPVTNEAPAAAPVAPVATPAAADAELAAEDEEIEEVDDAAAVPVFNPAATSAGAEAPAPEAPKRKRRTKAEIEAAKAAAQNPPPPPPANPPAPPAAPPSPVPPPTEAAPTTATASPAPPATPTPASPSPSGNAPASSTGAGSPLPLVSNEALTLDVLKSEMSSALTRTTAAAAQAALKNVPGGAASLSTADPANYPAIYAALRAL